MASRGRDGVGRVLVCPGDATRPSTWIGFRPVPKPAACLGSKTDKNRSVGRSGIGGQPSTASLGANAFARNGRCHARQDGEVVGAWQRHDDRDGGEGLVPEFSSGRRRRRASSLAHANVARMSSLHEPVPIGVYLGSLGSALFFVVLHFFNQWWFEIDLDR